MYVMINYRNQPVPRTLHDHFYPARTYTQSRIISSPDTPHYDIDSEMIHLLPTFHGLESENPYVHIREFEEVVGAFYSHQEP
jgi:hypothetical protein